MYFDRTRPAAKDTTRGIRRFDAVVLVLAVAGTAYACWSLYVTPIGGVRVVQTWLVILLSGLLFHRLLLVFQRTCLSDIGSVVGFLAHVLRWVVTLVLISFFTSFVNTQTDAREQRDIAQRLAPVLGFVDQSLSRNGESPQDLSEFLKGNPVGFHFHYRRSKSNYVISVRGGSTDIDGSTVFYNSKAKTWSRIHNDAMEINSTHPATLAYRNLTKDMTGKRYR